MKYFKSFESIAVQKISLSFHLHTQAEFCWYTREFPQPQVLRELFKVWNSHNHEVLGRGCWGEALLFLRFVQSHQQKRDFCLLLAWAQLPGWLIWSWCLCWSRQCLDGKISYVSSAWNPGAVLNKLFFSSCNTVMLGPRNGVWDMEDFLRTEFMLLLLLLFFKGKKKSSRHCKYSDCSNQDQH